MVLRDGPEDQSADIAENASSVTYGWGMIPGTVRIGRTEFTTSLFCKDDGYVVPVKAAVRKAERLELGDVVQMRLTIAM